MFNVIVAVSNLIIGGYCWKADCKIISVANFISAVANIAVAFI